MHREYHRWWSPALGRDMEVLVHGHAGARLIVFPASQSRFYNWEENSMVSALAEPLERGWVQMFSPDGVDSESWYASHRHPGARAWRQHQYDQYLYHELLPFTRWKNPNPFAITAGVSFGAYHAMNFALRHPDAVGRVIGMHGLYDIRRFTGGYVDDTVYFNNPMQFIANEHDHGRLEAIRRIDLIIVTDKEDALRQSSFDFSHELWAKGIPHALRVWDHWSHDWPFWKRMMNMYLSGPG